MLVEISHLSKSYDKTLALDDVNLQLQEGRVIGLLGPNGSGKTTLIKVLLGLLRQFSGEVKIDGKLIDDKTNAIVSYLPDKEYIPPEWNLEYACGFFSDFFSDFNRHKALELAKELNINPKDKIQTLPKGNQEKLALILTLAREVRLYIFDEPIAGADPIAREKIFNLILQNYNKQASVLISTHLISDVQHILDEAIFLHYGRIKLHSALSDLMKENEKQNLTEIFKEYCQ